MAQNEKEGFSFKVNGVELLSDKPLLSVQRILQIAREKGAIPQTADKYILKGEKGQYSPDAEVDLREDNLFITIPSGATPVALLDGPR